MLYVICDLILNVKLGSVRVPSLLELRTGHYPIQKVLQPHSMSPAVSIRPYNWLFITQMPETLIPHHTNGPHNPSPFPTQLQPLSVVTQSAWFVIWA